MACNDFNPFDPDTPNQVAETVLRGIEAAIGEAGLAKINRAYIGLGPTPVEDCCPDLVVWVSNIRLWDSNPPDTLIENEILTHFGVAFNINVRVGECFWELVQKGDKEFVPAPPQEITNMSKIINRYGMASFLGAIKVLMDLEQCGLSVTPYSSDPFQDGGCGGYNFVFAVGLV